MRERRFTLPEIVLMSATRGLIGFGAGLLLSERFSERLGRHRRRAVGWSLLATGLVSTIPLAVRFMRRRREESSEAYETEQPLTEQQQAGLPEDWQSEAAVIMAE